MTPVTQKQTVFEDQNPNSMSPTEINAEREKRQTFRGKVE
jgi:hypothetical protein